MKEKDQPLAQPQKPFHIVIDLETLDISPTALILSIGIAAGTSLTDYCIGQWNLSIPEQLRAGRTISPDTLSWWKEQPAEVWGAAIAEPLSVEFAIANLYKVFDSVPSGADLHVWGNSPSFDLAILSNLFNSMHLSVPWKYSQERDLRTLGAIFGEKFKNPNPTAHTAKGDAEEEFRFILKYLGELEKSNGASKS